MNIELLDSKNWKDRVTFYTSFTWKNPNHGILRKISQETTVPALEPALKAILSYPQKDYSNSKQILKHISNIKLKPLFINYFIKNYEEKDEMIEDIVTSIKTIKLPKTVAIYCEVLQHLVEHFRVCMFDMELFEVILRHGDPSVRKEGINLCVCVYKIEKENIFKYLTNVKEIQMKEIRERIGGYAQIDIQNSVHTNEMLERERIGVCEQIDYKKNKVKDSNMKVKNTIEVTKSETKESENIKLDQNEAKIGFMLDFEPKPFLKNYTNIVRNQIPDDDLVEKLKSTNYKERLEALNIVQNTDTILDSEIQSLIIKKISDVNLQVSMLAIECCVLLKNSRELIKALCDRLKDKRCKNLIFFVMNELKITNLEIFESVEFTKCKNPQMKASLLEFVKYGQFETYHIEAVVALTTDGNKDVRENAYECCKVIANTSMRNLLPEKIQAKYESKNANAAILTINKPMQRELHVKHEENVNEGSIEYFYVKYPFLKDISSTKRYDDIVKSNITADKYFVNFCCEYIDSYRRINEYILDECMKMEIPLQHYNMVINSFLSRLCDPSLKSKIKALVNYCYSLNSNETIKSLRHFLEQKKAGVLFCAALDIYGDVGALQDILYLEGLYQKGKNEKDSVCAAIKNIKEKHAQLSLLSSKSDLHQKPIQMTKRKHFLTRSVIIRQKISNRCKDCKNKEILFTEEFVAMLASKNDYKKVLSLFEHEDMISLSDYIIEYFDKHELLSHDYEYAKKFLSKLISYFIEKEYILREVEARMLCDILKNEKEMLLKLPLIYPKSKLEKLIVKQNEFDSMNASFLSLKMETSYINSPCKKSKPDVKHNNLASFKPFIDTNISDSPAEQETQTCKYAKEFVVESDKTKLNTSNNVATSNHYYENINGSINNYSKSIAHDQHNSSYTLDKAKLEKYSFEMSQYKTETLGVDRFALEQILANLIDSKEMTSKKAFEDLNTIIDTNITSLYFSRNAIVSSIIMQLSECLVTKIGSSELILSTLLKLCKNKGFISDLSYNAIHSINIDIINLIKDEKDSKNQNTRNVNYASDILLSICANGDCVTVFKSYLALFETITGDTRKLLYKLICKHAKHTKSIFDDKHKIQEIIDALNVFLENNCLKIIKNDVVAIKVIQLHINEFCLYFREAIYEFRLDGLVRRIVDKTMGKVKVEIEDVKRRIDELQRH